MNISLANPLPLALSHYVAQVRQTAERVGIPTTEVNAVRGVEGLRGPGGKVVAFWRAITNPERALREATSGKIMQLWPSLGYWDSLLWRTIDPAPYIVFHDPIALRPQFGYGRMAKYVASLAWSGSTATIIAHGSSARDVLESIYVHNPIIQVLHPIVTQQRFHEKAASGVVLVAGQNKSARNLTLLESLGPAIRSIGLEPKIVGSGWPKIAGWTVEDRFVPEAEMDRLLGEANLVLVPYSRYFQSGILLRALENGTLAISPRTPFSTSVLESTSALVEHVDDLKSWVYALKASAREDFLIAPAFQRLRADVDESWRQLVDG